MARHLLAALVLLFAVIVGLNTTLFEDHSVQFACPAFICGVNTPGLGFCIPGGYCDEGN